MAHDDASARHLAAGYANWVLSTRTGAGAIEFPTTAEAGAHEWDEDGRALVKDRAGTQFVGAPASVARRLHQLQEATAPDELLVTTITRQHADRVRS